MRLPPGKIPIEILQKVVFRNLGAKRREVAQGPSVGIDAAVINMGDKSIVVSMDPITGAIERIGWLAVNVNANDIATFGVEPEFYLSSIMLPEESGSDTLDTISTQMNKAAKTLGMAMVGGHCETTPQLPHPIVVGCAIGTTKKGNYVTAAGAKPGDRLILTKTAGIEGTAILASDMEQQLRITVSPRILRRARTLFDQISIVKDALTAFRSGGVHAMHDPTEGGLLGGIYEMALAADLGVNIHEEKIRVLPETNEICHFFKIDPLQLMSSGALLIAAEPKHANLIVKRLSREGIDASVIGHFRKKSEGLILKKRNGESTKLPEAPSDHLWTGLSGRSDHQKNSREAHGRAKRKAAARSSQFRATVER